MFVMRSIIGNGMFLWKLVITFWALAMIYTLALDKTMELYMRIKLLLKFFTMSLILGYSFSSFANGDQCQQISEDIQTQRIVPGIGVCMRDGRARRAQVTVNNCQCNNIGVDCNFSVQIVRASIEQAQCELNNKRFKRRTRVYQRVNRRINELFERAKVECQSYGMKVQNINTNHFSPNHSYSFDCVTD